MITKSDVVVVVVVLFSLVVMVTLGSTDDTEACNRNFGPRKSGDEGYKVSVVGGPTHYRADQVYTISIRGTFPNQTFTGFALNAVPRHAVDEGIALGTLQNIDPMKSKSVRACPHVITHADPLERKEEVQILWTAPSTGSGCVEFRAAVGDGERGWYKDDGALTKILCEEGTSSSSDGEQNDQADPAGMECCACGSAKYEMTFEGVWSQESHPRDYPTHRRLLHWSNIVGASHSKKFRIWEYGGYATKGVKEVCEFGYPRKVEEEVKANSREARTIIKTTGIWWKDPVGIVQNRSARFTTDRRRHFVSMITMLGPSPDWCVGISAENLCLPNCSWSNGFVVDLLPWDAGTDNGITYMSPNSKTDPQQRIRPITNSWPNDPRSPFFGPDPIKPVARLKIEKLSPKDETGTGTDPKECPDDAMVEFDFFGEGESAALDSEKKNEQSAGGKCEVLPWDDWSGCSVTCGVGTRMRRRRHRRPEATESECGLPLVERENCIGIENECEVDSDECAVTSWSDWSPCSVTCGKGMIERRRYYLNEGASSRCARNVEQVRDCMAAQVDCRPIKKSHEICSLSSLRGPCRGNFQRWHYDRRTKQCLPFQYGGCRGNGNRFETEEECIASCADDDERPDDNGFCLEPSEPGTCGKRREMWYFDRDMLKCLPFHYSGCGGNRNRFKTMDECTEACQSAAVGNGGNGGNDGNGGRCSLPAVPGPCRDLTERWYFDTQMQKCLSFDYGGCGGNENNFRTMDECTEGCQLASPPEGESGGRCSLPSETGHCREVLERWYFDTQMQKCLSFDYSGCGGNSNNFQTMDECTETCQLADRSDGGRGLILSSARCGLPTDAGPCRAHVERWYFDVQMRKCLPFDYGGCSGNANNFQSMEECSDVCRSIEEVDGTRGRCQRPADSGPCDSREERWYFDVQMEKCLPFEYGGCGGNENNFHTMDECARSCQDSGAPSGDRCALQADEGPCRGSMERWYFDRQMGKCLPFTYGGCAGNANNFETMDQCAESCHRDLPAEGGSGRCAQPHDQGPCAERLERWYFDVQMEKCLPFEYGGCGGNENNFHTMDECSLACQSSPGGDEKEEEKEKEKEGNRCRLPSERGPCSERLERWYYDAQMEKCLQFEYGGCHGNDNNFSTMEDCMEACRSETSTSATDLSTGRFKRFCTFASDRGPCSGNLERWHFDFLLVKCLPFHYGGCGGNANNFQTVEECMETCKDSYEEQNQNQLHAGRGSTLTSGAGTNVSNSGRDDSQQQQKQQRRPRVGHNNIHTNNYLEDLARCALEPDPGPCNAHVERWHFDERMEKCLPFRYGGCLGNGNNFEDMYTCMGACHLLGQRSKTTTAAPNGRPDDRCSLPAETGPCRSNLERWYFDGRTKSCLVFQYGGCSGNENNFHDRHACQAACGGSNVPFPADRNVSARCDQPNDPGTCTRYTEKWFFDRRMEKCLPFRYGGCQGNENRFDTMRSCMEACMPTPATTTTGGGETGSVGGSGSGDTKQTGDSSRCLLPPDGGPCKARIERWYYNPQVKSCLTFQYGGCAGNGNSFSSYTSCNETCRRVLSTAIASHTPATADLSFVTTTTMSTSKSSSLTGVVDCRMSSWSDWGACSATCGNGHRSRTREVLVQPSPDGKQCSKTLVRKQKCKLPPCEHECQYGHWSAWSSCTKSCGYGSYRQRTQKPVPPSGGKIKCVDRVQRAICELPKCRY